MDLSTAIVGMSEDGDIVVADPMDIVVHYARIGLERHVSKLAAEYESRKGAGQRVAADARDLLLYDIEIPDCDILDCPLIDVGV